MFFSGVTTVILASIASWLLSTEFSPFSNYLLHNPAVPNLWGTANVPSYLIGAFAAGNAHDINTTVAWIAFFVQWMLVGMICGIVLNKMFFDKPRN